MPWKVKLPGAKGSSRALLREKTPIDTAIGTFFSPMHHRKEHCDTEKPLKPFTKLTTHTMHFMESQSRDVTSWKSYPGPCSSFQAKVCRSWLRLPHNSLSSLAMTNSQKRQFHNHPGQPALCLISITA